MLIVAQNLVDLVTLLARVCANGLARVVTAENHEDVLMVPDKFLPRLLAGVALGLHSPRISRLVRLHIGVRQDNDPVVRVLRDDSVCPIQNFIARLAFKCNNEEAHSCCLEVVPGIVMAIWIESAAKLASFCELVAGKVGVEMRGAVDADIPAILIVRLLKTHVMISQAHAVGHFPVQYRHRFPGDGPFLRGVRLHNISFVDEKGDVESLRIVTYPAGLLEKVVTQVSITPLAGQLESGVAVKLSVRQNRDRERLIGLR